MNTFMELYIIEGEKAHNYFIEPMVTSILVSLSNQQSKTKSSTFLHLN